MESPTVIENRTAKRFIPPTLEEVTAYCQERGNNVNPQRFIDYYETRGWVLKTGQKVKDWKACVRTWEGNDNPKPAKKQAAEQKTLPAQNFSQRDYSGVNDELMAQLARDMAAFEKGGTL